jgi:hypothetical protein
VGVPDDAQLQQAGVRGGVTDQKAHSFMRAHEHAFLEFGGVPRVVRHDYVARHIIHVLCPSPLCGRDESRNAY